MPTRNEGNGGRLSLGQTLAYSAGELAATYLPMALTMWLMYFYYPPDEQGNVNGKKTEAHAAAVVGDTVGDPFKDTSSVALNPVIKFTTLFGLLAVEIAVTMTNASLKAGIGAVLFFIALVFVYRSFYAMRIPTESAKK